MPQHAGTIDRLYILNGGLAVTPDRAMYTPGRWQGERVELSCHAYLIQRRGQWILWDTGIDDRVAADLGGRIIAHDIRGIVIRSLARQLGDIGLTPADVSTVILSHGHFDHVGNARLFGHATWYMHRDEHAAMFGRDPARHGYSPELYDVLKAADVRLADGDLELFGDDSIRLLATPGHTPGHCSLLVRLARTGTVVLSADIAHDRYNLAHRCVPPMNSDAEATIASMARVEALVADENARLWINHDIVESAAMPHAPAWFD